MRARLQVEGLREAMERLDAVGERANKPEPALTSPRTLRALQQGEQRVFAGARFPRNTSAWDSAKRKRGLSPRRMQATGYLRMILTAGGPSTNGLRFRAYRGELFWGLEGGRSNVYYAYALALRDKRRKVVKIDRIAKETVAAITTGYVAEGRL